MQRPPPASYFINKAIFCTKILTPQKQAPSSQISPDQSFLFQANNPHRTLLIPFSGAQIKENKRRPQLTSIIAASSGAMKADEVAKKALNGIKSASFMVPCNLEGFLLAIATAGLSPQRSFLMAFIEVVAIGILRVAGLCFQWNWYGSIEKWHAQKK